MLPVPARPAARRIQHAVRTFGRPSAASPDTSSSLIEDPGYETIDDVQNASRAVVEQEHDLSRSDSHEQDYSHIMNYTSGPRVSERDSAGYSHIVKRERDSAVVMRKKTVSSARDSRVASLAVRPSVSPPPW